MIKLDIKKLMLSIKSFNDLLDIFMMVFFLITRLFIIMTIYIIFSTNNIKSFWLLDICFISYVLYPIYITVFDKLFYIIMGQAKK